MTFFERLFGRTRTRTREKPREQATAARVGRPTPATPATPTPASAPGSPEPEQAPRRYLEGSEYLLPKDLGEEERLNFQHYALNLTLGNHYLAPLPPAVHVIVDSGCGTGVWPADMARLFQSSLVLGLDRDTASFGPSVPANCLLRQGNILTGLPLPDQIADYTHQRLLVLAIPDEHWPGVVHELVRVTRVGGWIELVETDARVRDGGPATTQMFAWLDLVRATRGLQGMTVARLGELLRAEGLQEIEARPITLKVGAWGERAGAMMECDIVAAVQALKQPCCGQLGVDVLEFDACVQAMKVEWQHAHAFVTIYAAYGKRVM